MSPNASRKPLGRPLLSRGEEFAWVRIVPLRTKATNWQLPHSGRSFTCAPSCQSSWQLTFNSACHGFPPLCSPDSQVWVIACDLSARPPNGSAMRPSEIGRRACIIGDEPRTAEKFCLARSLRRAWGL